MSLLFDESYYLESKARQLNKTTYGKTWTSASVSEAFTTSGLTAEKHYDLYGAYETGVNPSATLDDELYYYDKGRLLSSSLYLGLDDWNVDSVKYIFNTSGLSPLEHYESYGKPEGLSPKASQTPTLSDTTANSSNITGALYAGSITWNELSGASAIRYKFMSSKADPGDETWSDLANFIAMDSTQRNSVRAALSEVTSVTGVVFIETNDNAVANLWIGTGDLGGKIAGTAYYPYYSESRGHIVSSLIIDNDNYHSLNPSTDKQWYETLLHELGHSMGLKHPFEGDVTLAPSADNTSNTLMSYTDSPLGPFNTFRPYDVLALQYIYGQDGIGGVGMTTWG